MMILNSKVHKPHPYTNSYLKDKDALTSYQDFSSRVSSEIDTNFKNYQNPSHELLESMVAA